MGTLYLVSTPIGNLKDVTLRAIEVLNTVDLVLVEDSRRAKKLLSHYKIETSIDLLFEHNEEKKIEDIINKIESGQNIAVISDAGTPLINDPGYKLVRSCIQKSIKVVPVPGPSAVLSSLIASGLPPDSFLFIGFFPKKTSKQNQTIKLFKNIWEEKDLTIIFFESPFRLQKTLKLLAENFPERDISVSRELTKVNEEFVRGTVKDVSQRKIIAKGEITILLH